MTKAYFITGTDTDVGKTYVATGLVKYFVQLGFKTLGMKPIASGCKRALEGVFKYQLVNEDLLALQSAGNVNAPLNLINPYRFSPAIAPHIAAAEVQIEMQLDVIVQAYQHLTNLADVIIVEGAGGFLVPINATQTLADMVLKIKIPLILVIGIRLGCINHALLTVEAIKARKLEFAGWIANQIDPEFGEFKENLASLKMRIEAPCLGVVSWQGQAAFENFYSE